MFDWARGSMLKRLLQTGLYFADWRDEGTSYLNNWKMPWFLGAVEFRRGLRVLDVGGAGGGFSLHLAEAYGCDAHVLDIVPTMETPREFGLPAAGSDVYSKVTVHAGLAGQDVLPAESFDIVYCNSTLEHTYDRCEALDPLTPLSHLEVLRDLCRMVRPGGLLLLNWDTYLDGVPHHLGWEYEADIWLLQHCGMRLALPNRRTRPAHYIASHPDSLFWSFPAVMPFLQTTLPHGTSINAVWIKPGAPAVTGLLPRPDLRELYLPPGECHPLATAEAPVIPTPEIDARFKRIISAASATLARAV